MKKDILESIQTKERSLELLQLFESILQKSYKKKFNMTLLKDLPINADNKETAMEEIRTAKEQITKAEIVNLTLFIDPDLTFISKLYSWFKNNGFNNFLLDITVDHKINGGVQISYKGKYVDLSVNKKVYEYVRK